MGRTRERFTRNRWMRRKRAMSAPSTPPITENCEVGYEYRYR